MTRDSHTPREAFLRSARLFSERRLPVLLMTGPMDLGLPVNHDVVLGFDFGAEAVEFGEW